MASPEPTLNHAKSKATQYKKREEKLPYKIKLRKGLDTVESLSVEGKGSKTLGKIFLVL